MLDKLTENYEVKLDLAFDYWINVMRWITGDASICRFNEKKQISYGSIYLMDSESKMRFYNGVQRINGLIRSPIKKQEWKKVQTILSENKIVPIWQLFYSKAMENLSLNDIEGFIINLAISVETIIRHLTKELLREPINLNYQSIVNSISIARILNNWYKIGFDCASWRNLDKERKNLIKLFEYRNAIMHRGEKPKINQEMKRSLISATGAFLKHGEQHINL